MLRVCCVCLGLGIGAVAAGAGLAFPQSASPSRRRSRRQPEPQPAPPPCSRSPAAGAGPGGRCSRDGPDQAAAGQGDRARPRAKPSSTPSSKSAPSGGALATSLLIYAALLVAVGAFLAIAFAVQMLYLGLGLRSMRRSSQRGRAQRHGGAARLRLYQRSDLERRPATASDQPDLGQLRHERRRGSFASATNWKASHGELPADFDINYVRAPENLFLGPNSNGRVRHAVHPDARHPGGDRGARCISMSGAGRPTRICSGAAKPHFFEFCHRLEVGGRDARQHRLRFRANSA